MEIKQFFTDLTIINRTVKKLTCKANYVAGHGYDVTIITESQLERKPTFPLSHQIILNDNCLDFNYNYWNKLSFQNKIIKFKDCIYKLMKKIQKRFPKKMREKSYLESQDLITKKIY